MFDGSALLLESGVVGVGKAVGWGDDCRVACDGRVDASLPRLTFAVLGDTSLRGCLDVSNRC